MRTLATTAGSEYIFTAARGKAAGPISRPAFAQRLAVIAERAGVPRVLAHPHAFRAFASTRMINQKKMNLIQIARVLGHSSTRQLELRDARPQPADLYDAMFGDSAIRPIDPILLARARRPWLPSWLVLGPVLANHVEAVR
jgi:integrase